MGEEQADSACTKALAVSGHIWQLHSCKKLTLDQCVPNFHLEHISGFNYARLGTCDAWARLPSASLRPSTPDVFYRRCHLKHFSRYTLRRIREIELQNTHAHM
jgi:hypothetical protein